MDRMDIFWQMESEPTFNEWLYLKHPERCVFGNRLAERDAAILDSEYEEDLDRWRDFRSLTDKGRSDYDQDEFYV